VALSDYWEIKLMPSLLENLGNFSKRYANSYEKCEQKYLKFHDMLNTSCATFEFLPTVL